MNQKILVGVLITVLVVIGAYAILKNQTQSGIQGNTFAGFDPLNATYVIDGQAVTLVNGKAEKEATPGSATKITTTIFGQPTSGDLNNDGEADAAIILVQDPGGSGTFYYAAAAINTANGAQGTNAVLLGDRIAPQNIEIKNGQVVANYVDRKPGESMTTTPSVGVSVYLTYDGSILKTAAPSSGPGGRCGGNMTTAPGCMVGYHCAPDPTSHLPFGDVGGTCVSN
jgi:hypothetical protein